MAQDSPDAGSWTLSGGAVEFGETAQRLARCASFPSARPAASWCDARVQRPASVERSLGAGRRAGTIVLHGGSALVRAVRRLVDRAVDEILLGEQRVTSAVEATRLLAGEEKSEALAGDVQRVI